MRCNSCNQEREYFKEGVCIICHRVGKGVNEVQTNKFKIAGSTEVKSTTGKVDENIYLRI